VAESGIRDAGPETRATNWGTGRVFRSTSELASVLLFSVAAGIGGAMSGCEPSGVAWANPIITGVFAFGIAFLGAFAAWRWMLVATAIALVATRTWLGTGAGIVAFGFIGYSSTRRRPPRSFRCAAAALVIQILLRLPTDGRTGLSAAIALIGCGCIAVPALMRSPRRIRRPILLTCGGLAGFALITSALFAVGIILGQSNLEGAVTAASRAIDAASSGDTQQASQQFDRARSQFASANSALNSWWSRPARFVPFVGLQARAVQDVAEQGAVLSNTSFDAVSTVERNRIAGKGGQFDLKAIHDAVPSLDSSASELTKSVALASAVDSPWLLSPLASRLQRFATEATRAEPVTKNAALAARLAPVLLGGDKPAVYFVAFVTPAEQRGSGGFMGSFAEVTIDHGKLDMTRYGRTTELNMAHNPAQPIAGPAEWVRNYGPIDPGVVWSNITMSPDLPSIAQVIGQLYPASGGKSIDGVLVVDPAGLAALLKITGPVQVPGMTHTLTAKNAEQFLNRDQYTEAGSDNERTDVLADAAEVTFRKLMRADIPRPDKLADIVGPAVAGSHLRWYQLDEQTRPLTEVLGTTGSLHSGPGDFVQLVTQNYANNKLDAYLHRSMSYDITVDPTTGAAAGTAHVELDNQGPDSGLPTGVIGNDRGVPKGTNISQVELYSALTTTEVRVDGQPVSLRSFGEADRHVATVLVSIPSGTHRTIDFAVSGVIDLPGGNYRLTVGHQVMINPDTVEASIVSYYSGRPAHGDGNLFIDTTGRVAFTATLDERLTASAVFGR